MSGQTKEIIFLSFRGAVGNVEVLRDADPGPGHLTEKRRSTGMEDEGAGGGKAPDRRVEK